MESTPENTEIQASKKSKTKTDNLVEPNNQLEIKLDNFSNAGEMMRYAELLIESKLLPAHIKTPQAALVIMQKGKDLGFPLSSAFDYIYVIDGKPSLSSQALGAILRKGNIAYKTVKDFEPVYETDSITGEKVKYRRTEAGVVRDDEKGTGYKKIDTETVIEFYRKWNGSTITELALFKLSEAKEQGLLDRPVWMKMPSTMLWHRAFAKGARRVAPDLMLGLYTIYELADSSAKDINYDEIQ